MLAYLLIMSHVIKLDHLEIDFGFATVHYQYHIVSCAYKPDLKKFVQMYRFGRFR